MTISFHRMDRMFATDEDEISGSMLISAGRPIDSRKGWLPILPPETLDPSDLILKKRKKNSNPTRKEIEER